MIPCAVSLLCVCKPEAQMVARGTSGIPPGMGGLLPVMQAGTTGLSWEAAGFQHMGTVVTAVASLLRPLPGWSFSSLVSARCGRVEAGLSWLDAGQGWRRAVHRVKEQLHCCLPDVHCSFAVGKAHGKPSSPTAAKHSPEKTQKVSWVEITP